MSKRAMGALACLSSLTIVGCGTVGHASLHRNSHHAQTKRASSKRPADTASSNTASPFRVLGFWDHHLAGPASALAQSGHTLSAISPLWYSVTASGAVTSNVDAALLAEAHKQHLAITPLINDATGKQTFLTSKSTRTVAVLAIEHVLATMKYQGVNIDFEPPQAALQSDLTAFMVQLRDTLPKTDRITLDVVPHSGGAYDYAKLAPEVNQFVLMSYDEHSDGTEAGPVAALNWVKSITTRLTGQIPPSKLDLGIALYGYSWAAGSTHALTIPYNQITAAEKTHATWNSRYDETTATVNGHTLWWENRKSIAEKIALAKSDHLAGIALWQVGYANPAIYQTLTKAIGT